MEKFIMDNLNNLIDMALEKKYKQMVVIMKVNGMKIKNKDQNAKNIAV